MIERRICIWMENIVMNNPIYPFDLEQATNYVNGVRPMNDAFNRIYIVGNSNDT